MSTEAVAAPAAEAPSEAASEDYGHPIADALLAIPDSTEAQSETEAGATEAEPAAAPEKPAAKGKKPKVDWDALFAEEKLATPEGLKAARDANLEMRRENNKKYLELGNREARFKEQLATFRGEKEQTQALTRMLTVDLQALRTGKPEAALKALANLSGADPLKLLEEINLNFAGGGQKQEAQLVRELRGELTQLRQELQQERIEQQRGQSRQFIQQRKAELLNAASDATRYPHLAELAASDARGVADHITAYIVREHNAGRRLDDATAIGHIEAELARFRGPRAAAPQGDAGRETSAFAKPESGQAPRPPGKSLNPSLATQNGGGTRVLTPDEQRAALHASPDEILRDLGLPY